LEYTRLKVKPHVDIWSLGCVFSEAAVWLTLGKAGLEQYRQRRRSETQRIYDFHDHGCFHDGKEVLESVSDMHNEVSSCVRSCDFITKAVVGSKRKGTRPLVKGLITEMLTTKDRRFSADQVRGSAEDILKEAQTALEEAEQSPAIRSRTFPTGSKRPPPVLPTSKSDPPLVLDAPFEDREHEQLRPLSGDSLGLVNTPVPSTSSSHKTPPTSPRMRDFRTPHRQNLSIDTFSAPNTPTRTGVHGLSNGLAGLGIEVQNMPDQGGGELENRYMQPSQHAIQHATTLPTREGKEPEAMLTIGQLLQYIADKKNDSPPRLNGDWLLSDLKKRDYVC
jgi:serine/threonine protein kinase